MIDLIKTPNIRKYTLIIGFSYIVNALIYYGFSFNMSDFGGNFYITFLLSGLVELPSTFMALFLYKFVPRKRFYVGFMLIIALSAFAVIPSKAEWLKVSLALLGKFAVSISWNVIGLISTELYPTVIRNTGKGVIGVVARIGSISAPFMGDLVRDSSLCYHSRLHKLPNLKRE